MKCVYFAANAWVKIYGDIYWSSWPSLLHDKLSMYKSDSDRFLSITVVYTSSDTPLIQMRTQQPSKTSWLQDFEIFKISSGFQDFQ